MKKVENRVNIIKVQLRGPNCIEKKIEADTVFIANDLSPYTEGCLVLANNDKTVAVFNKGHWVSFEIEGNTATSIPSKGGSDQIKKHVIEDLMFESEEICSNCDNVFTMKTSHGPCPECGGFMYACNACMWSTDLGDCAGCIKGNKFKESANVHITYNIGENNIRYWASDGSSGRDPSISVRAFQQYWNDYYKGARVTYEEI